MAAAKKRRRRRKKWTLPKIQYRKVITSLLLLSVAAFTVAMTVVYIQTGGVPDTLVTAFFAFAGGEAGCLGLLKHSDNKYGSADQSDPAPDSTDSTGSG